MQDPGAVAYAIRHCTNAYEADIAIPAYIAGYQQAMLEDLNRKQALLERVDL